MNDILNGIVNFDNTFVGILPYSSGNDFARTIKIESIDPISLIDSYVNHGKSIKVDYLLLNGTYRVINNIGVGRYEKILESYNKIKHFKLENRYTKIFFRRNKMNNNTMNQQLKV